MLRVALLLTARTGRRITRRQHLDGDEAVGEAERRLDGVGEPAHTLATGDQTVDDDVDVVLAGLRELRHLLDRVDGAVDPYARVAVGRELLEHRGVLALTAADDRGEDLEAGAVGELGDLVDDLLGGLPSDRRAAVRTVRMTDAGVEQAEVVVDLGDRADGRTWVARRRLLVDRDRGREALDEVDVRLVHLPEELARVRGQRLDVAALPFGVDGVEREARLARPGEPGEDRQAVTGDLEVDVLEVVLPRSAHDDAGVGGPAFRRHPRHPRLRALDGPSLRSLRRGEPHRGPARRRRWAPLEEMRDGHGPAHRARWTVDRAP